jgi:hypothetical protein
MEPSYVHTPICFASRPIFIDDDDDDGGGGDAYADTDVYAPKQTPEQRRLRSSEQSQRKFSSSCSSPFKNPPRSNMGR